MGKRAHGREKNIACRSSEDPNASAVNKIALVKVDGPVIPKLDIIFVQGVLYLCKIVFSVVLMLLIYNC